MACFQIVNDSDANPNTCPMAELVTASDCYCPNGSPSEGREFEPHWGSLFLQICLLAFLYRTWVKFWAKPSRDVDQSQKHCIAHFMETSCTGILEGRKMVLVRVNLIRKLLMRGGNIIH